VIPAQLVWNIFQIEGAGVLVPFTFSSTRGAVAGGNRRGVVGVLRPVQSATALAFLFGAGLTTENDDTELDERG
jgi:hypothetical protein